MMSFYLGRYRLLVEYVCKTMWLST